MSFWRQLEDIVGPRAITGAWQVVTLPTPSADEVPWVDVSDEEQLQEVLFLARRESRRLLPAGAGEHLAPELVAEADAIVSLRRLARVVDHEPEDLTLVAQSGVPLHELDTLLAAHGQELPVDCGRGSDATLGGAVSANRSGLHRLVSGTWRDHVLGARVLHADGTVTRTGSRVVKSVSGYDLAKLYVGSQGSLAFLLDLNLRLQCAPPVTRSVRHRVDTQSVIPVLQALRDHSSLQPVSILLVAEPAGDRSPQALDIVVRFRGRPEVVARQEEQCLSLLGGTGLDESQSVELAQRLRRQMDIAPESASLRLLTLPVAVAPLAVRWQERFEAASGFVAHFGVGVACLRLSRTDAEQLDRELRRSPPQPGHWFWEHCPTDWIPQPVVSSPPALSLHQAVRHSFDPQRRFVSRLVSAPTSEVGT